MATPDDVRMTVVEASWQRFRSDEFRGNVVWFVQLALIALVVEVLDGLSLYIAHASNVEILWPAKGVVLAICLLVPARSRTSALAAAGLGGVLGELALRATFAYAAFGTSITILGVVLALFFVDRAIGPEIDFRDWRSLTKFLFLACFAAMIIGIPGSLFSGWMRGTHFLRDWATWSLSTGLSYSIFTPTIVLLATMSQVSLAQRRAKERIIAANVVMFALLSAVFFQPGYPATYFVPMGLLGVTLVAEIEGASVALLLTAIVAIITTTAGYGPAVALHVSPSERILAVQFMLVTLTFGMIPTAAALTERRRLRDGLAEALDQSRRAADLLREQEELYRLMADNASDIVIRTDLSGHIQYIAPSIERILGYTVSELIGNRFRDLLVEEDATRFAQAAKDAFHRKAGAGEVIEYRARHKDGREVWLESCPTIGRDSQGVVVGILDIARDVTARKAMEDALIEARKNAEVAAEAKSEFLANMSHELRTPLTTVIGFADALNDYCDLDSKAKHFTERVRNASRALLSTVNNILDYSKVERGLFEYEPEYFPAKRHFEETIEIFAVQAKEKGLALRLECPAVLRKAELFADPFRLRQVLINLIGNAMKFTDEGSVTLRVEYVEGILVGEGRLICSVVDTGAGIPANRIDLLFQRFSQVDKQTSRRYGGTGLGLAICKGVVCGMGGEIGVTTVEGKGSTFRFELPVQIRIEAESPRTASRFVVQSSV